MMVTLGSSRDAKLKVACGLNCRSCGCRHFWVVYTRRGWGGKLIRRRECRHCGKRMTTWEKPVGR
ncbi:MAG: transcriptional regulator NrdR [Planctomycetes bacterium ADurb.Bin126]|nr:MAG: transcriptional regulator NrdR [Planctomycetes bacterium ADurb.Bin126]